MYRNILVPVDGSAFSREAVLHGLRIASQCGATLRLVRVSTSSLIVSSSEMIMLQGQVAKQARSAELAELYAIAAECRAHTTIPVTASLQHGPVVDALIGYAKRHGVDLIVMRSHARRGIARVWFGSTADGLIRRSGIPVLIVRPPSVATGIQNGPAFKRILVPLDGSALAEQALEPATALARTEGASVTLLRIVAPSLPKDANDLQSTIGPASAREVGEAREYLDSVASRDGRLGLIVNTRVIIAGDPARAILNTADAEETDLIAMATHGRGAIGRVTAGSVADEVMRESAVSTLVVHRMQSPVLETTPMAALAPALA